MSTITGIIATLVASHLGGSALGGILAKFGLLGFGRKLTIASHILNVGKSLKKSYDKERNHQNRADLKRWLQTHDPQNESKLGDGVLGD
ncbi:MAG: hypothetical protein JKY95_07570 [Planctomycetaceae bacterium]|nr:hypothetical protein [Planctomycetaceae bacterium]